MVHLYLKYGLQTFSSDYKKFKVSLKPWTWSMCVCQLTRRTISLPSNPRISSLAVYFIEITIFILQRMIFESGVSAEVLKGI